MLSSKLGLCFLVSQRFKETKSTAKKLCSIKFTQSHSIKMPNKNSIQTSKKESGFSLLEVLISILILSFGILGMVGLQASSLQISREARLQASAVRFAEEMAELMRSNKNEALKPSNAYLISFSETTDTNSDTANCGYPGKSACGTSEDIAKRDRYEWIERLNQELPDARVEICQDSTPYDADGLPQWACSGSGGTLVLKIGWTRSNTLRGASGTDATTTSGANTGAFDKALRPAVVFPVTPGSTT
jgi:type IV pilus assembly protein PilV